MVKPVKFTRDSGFLARDEFLVIFMKEDHILIYMYTFAIVLLLGTMEQRVCNIAPINTEREYANSEVNNDIVRTDIFGRRNGRDSHFF